MISLNCWRTQHALAAADREELSPAVRQFVERHLTRCPRCAEDERWRQLTRQALHGQGFVGAPAGFAARAVQRCEQVRRRSPLGGVTPLMGQVAGVGAALALCVFGARVVHRSVPAPPAPSAVQVASLLQPTATLASAAVQPAGGPSSLSRVEKAANRGSAKVVVSPPRRQSRNRSTNTRRRPRRAPRAVLAGHSTDPSAIPDLSLRQSAALLAEGQYRAALAHCQEAAGGSLSARGRRRLVQLAGRVHAAAGDIALERILNGDPESPQATSPTASRPRAAGVEPSSEAETVPPLPDDPVALKRSADELARRGADPTLVAARYREAQRALQRTVAQKRDPKALLALAGAYEAVAERTSAVKAYSELVENFPDSKESRTAVQRLAQLT